jgi:hypothetical protein
MTSSTGEQTSRELKCGFLLLLTAIIINFVGHLLHFVGCVLLHPFAMHKHILKINDAPESGTAK